MAAVPAGARNLNPDMLYGGSSNTGSADPAMYGAPLPQIPPRRLFQIPEFTTASSPVSESPLGVVFNHTTALGTVNPAPSLVTNGTAGAPGGRLGGNNSTSALDQREHPYYRTEWLQKVLT